MSRSKVVFLCAFFAFAWACSSEDGGTTPSVSVSLSPSASNVHVTRTLQFTATVRNASNGGVTWSLSGPGCSGASCGTISNTGLYTAPADVPDPATVTVRATSVADTSKSASATLTIRPAVVMEVTPADQAIDVGRTGQFSVSVQNAADSGVTWSLSGPGCSGASCGTISNGGLYTAPASSPARQTVMVTATSVEDTLASASATVTVMVPDAVVIWPPSAKVPLGDGCTFGALAHGAIDDSVTWAISGAGCTGTGCGTISDQGVYAAPAVMPNPGVVTVTATSVVDPTKSATATVEIMASQEAKLNGAYAYLYQGFAAYQPGITCGMFVADGQGHILSGVSDRTWIDAVGGNLLNAGLTGFYTMTYDNRGDIWLESPAFGNVLYVFALDAAGDEAFLQPFFDGTTRLLGTLVKQDISAFSNAGINGDYVFQWLGASFGGARLGAIGRLHADGFGHITSGTLDINDGTSVQSGLDLSGSYSVSGNGRATASLTIGSLGTFAFVFYVLSPGSFFMSSVDTVTASVPMWSGRAHAQSGGPFSNASLQGTGIFDLLGRPGPGQAKATAGFLTSDGNGNITGTADINTNAVLSENTSYTATYSVSASGRGTMTSPTLPSLIFYLVRPGTALLLEAPGPALEMGSLEPQVALPYDHGVLVGRFAEGASVPPPYADNQTVTAALWYDAAGNVAWNAEVNSSTGGLVSTDGYGVVATVAPNGRAVLTDVFGNHSYDYIISPMRFVAVQGPTPQQAMVDQNLLFRNIRRP